MTTRFDEIVAETLGFRLEERAELAARLLASLDEPTTDEVERLWQEEAQRRLAAWRRGETAAIPAGDVFRRAISDLG